MNNRTGKELKRPSGPLVKEWKRHIWDRMIVDPSGCWILQTPRNEKGYTKLHAPVIGTIYGHRLSFLAYRGDVPRGAMVLHSVKCTSRACVNPDHLRIGTAKENAEDREKAGRTVRGASHPKSKLTDAQIERIRELEDVPAEILAEAFDVTPAHINQIKAGTRR